MTTAPAPAQDLPAHLVEYGRALLRQATVGDAAGDPALARWAPYAALLGGDSADPAPGLVSLFAQLQLPPDLVPAPLPAPVYYRPGVLDLYATDGPGALRPVAALPDAPQLRTELPALHRQFEDAWATLQARNRPPAAFQSRFIYRSTVISFDALSV